VELEVWVGEPTTRLPAADAGRRELLTTGNGVEVGDLVAGDGDQL
jgi:hypothetical protein